MNSEIHISEDTRVPVYLQIKYQLTYLIRSGSLATGTRLPTVRALARTLGVSAGTVMKAYTELQVEGYLTGRAGGGTTIATPPPNNTGVAHREGRALAEESLQSAFRYAYALGFSSEELSEFAFSLLQRTRRVVPIGFAGSTPRMSKKYADELDRLLGVPEVEVRHITASPLGGINKWGISTSEAAKLDGLFFLATFSTFVPELAQALGNNIDRYEILGMAIEPTRRTSAQLRAIPAGDGICFVASPKFFHSFVPFIKSHLLLPNTSLHMIRDSQDGLVDLERSIEGADTIVHNVGLSSMLDQLGIPDTRRIELDFSFADASVAALRARITSSTRRPGPTPIANESVVPEKSTQDEPIPHSNSDKGGGTEVAGHTKN